MYHTSFICSDTLPPQSRSMIGFFPLSAGLRSLERRNRIHLWFRPCRDGLVCTQTWVTTQCSPFLERARLPSLLGMSHPISVAAIATPMDSIFPSRAHGPAIYKVQQSPGSNTRVLLMISRAAFRKQSKICFRASGLCHSFCVGENAITCILSLRRRPGLAAGAPVPFSGLSKARDQNVRLERALPPPRTSPIIVRRRVDNEDALEDKTLRGVPRSCAAQRAGVGNAMSIQHAALRRPCNVFCSSRQSHAVPLHLGIPHRYTVINAARTGLRHQKRQVCNPFSGTGFDRFPRMFIDGESS
ncbi:hypothetical protein BV25DRAFT_494864 [Artomyces pyxidatus]|uniref:Uncharacterized protein n=1 Tax=Artomyces pyxidatus TaxID=48021 RepID=A0ACB8T3G1_9AGAM|nr:hypothetical protein BV25DRAFT_494864 [Artomyces pyxidatus]